MRPEILISDKVHIHKKNFLSLFKFLESKNIRYKSYVRHDELRNCTLDVYTSSEKLIKYAGFLQEKNGFEELFEFKYCGVSVFEIVRAELLSCLIYRGLSNFNFRSGREAFDYFSSRHLEDLLAAYRAALFWLDAWSEELSENSFKYAIIFSGSSIAAKALLYLCRFNSVEPLLAEGFFTGRHFYLENKYEPIANNSDLRFVSVAFCPEVDQDRWPKTCDYLSSVGVYNKNVKQPKEKSPPPFDSYLLLTCQVVNDYSLIDSSRELVSSVELYKKVIKEVVEKTDFNLVVKVHPWERNKTESRSATTLEALSEYLKELDPKKAERVFLTENSNLSQLISNSITTITLCSQSGLEACFLGKKPITIGGAFYSNKGFTYDIEMPAMLGDLLSGSFESELTLTEFNKYIAFMNYCLCEHLIRSDADVFKLLDKIFVGCRPLPRSHKTPIRTYKYELEPIFLKRNFLKLAENPYQLFRDIVIICGRVSQKLRMVNN
ncbi:hypothetical protein ACJJID_05815 [Microbulbifer sp. CnH-101-G]|uniref:capsular polysaccharide export protein, LipB/KpsS family n=1 Tax=Microbulbifer sp. CnH-101-G TaxID=3243393 RepID=UPI00403A54D3